MKKSHIAVILVFMSTGCASVRVGDLGHQRVVLPVDPHAPNISIATDPGSKDIKSLSIVIDQEPIVLTDSSIVATAGTPPPLVTIKWALPLLSNYYFDQSAGIVIGSYDGGPLPEPAPSSSSICKPDKKVYTCTYKKPPTGTKYKYSVLVWDSATQQTLVKLDPTVWN
jgi:hypothetical protein